MELTYHSNFLFLSQSKFINQYININTDYELSNTLFIRANIRFLSTMSNDMISESNIIFYEDSWSIVYVMLKVTNTCLSMYLFTIIS